MQKSTINKKMKRIKKFKFLKIKIKNFKKESYT